MFYKIENYLIVGFYEENINDKFIEIEQEVYKELLDKQSEGYTLTCNLDNIPNPQILEVWETWNGIEKIVDENKKIEREKLLKTIFFNSELNICKKLEYSGEDYDLEEVKLYMKSINPNIEASQKIIVDRPLIFSKYE